jgi:hypothetical protein
MSSSGRCCRGPTYQPIHTDLAGANFAFGWPKSDICTRVALLTYRFPVQHATSGWTTFRVRSKDDLKHAVWLLKLSYLRYVLKTAADPLALVVRASEQLQLSPRFKTLVAALLPNTAKRASAGAVAE